MKLKTVSLSKQVKHIEKSEISGTTRTLQHPMKLKTLSVNSLQDSQNNLSETSQIISVNEKKAKKQEEYKIRVLTKAEQIAEPEPINAKVESPETLKEDLKSTEKINTIPPKRKGKVKFFSQIDASGFTQTKTGIKDVIGNMIITNDNKYHMIMEIFPINYYQRDEANKLAIIENFKSLFIECPIDGHFKMTMEKTNVKTFINHLREVCPDDCMDEARLDIRDQLIEKVQELGTTDTINYRYYFIFKYEGNTNGQFSSDINEIYQAMMVQRYSIKSILETYGNLVAESENPTLHTIETLYKLFCKKSSETESIVNRVIRIQSDYRKFCASRGIEYSEQLIDKADYFSPKGMAFSYHPETALIDGLYTTYLVIKDNGYPSAVIPDWFNLVRSRKIMVGFNVDIDFFYHKLNYDITLNAIERKKTWQSVSYKQTNREGQKNSLANKLTNSNYIIDRMRKYKEDLFDCCTVFTLYGPDLKKLLAGKGLFIKHLSGNGIKCEESFYDTEDFYDMTRPLCHFQNKIFRRNSRNMLTSTLRDLYCFTTYTLSDPKGLIMGPNLENNTIFAFDNFNTGLFKNGNILIIGPPGSGKTYLTLALAARWLVNGVKVYFILPTKGYEYQGAVEKWGGIYLKVVPGAKFTFNPMEIYPQKSSILEVDKDNEEEKDKDNKTPLLVKKITYLCSFFKLLADSEGNSSITLSAADLNRMNSLLKELYADFNITEDDNSIWRDKATGRKRRSPQFEDWQKRIKGDPRLSIYAELLDPFISGTFSNFNGQTDIDIDKKVIAFDVEAEDIGEDLLPSIMYLCQGFVNEVIRADMNTFGVSVTDEAWRLMQSPSAAQQMQKEARLIRGYGGACCFATQNIQEFKNPAGEAIIACSESVIVLSLKPSQFKVVSEVLELTDRDKIILTETFAKTRGCGLFISNGSKIMFQLDTSVEEEALYTTDLNVKRTINEKLKAKELERKIKMSRTNK